MNINSYLDNVKTKLERGYKKEAREMLDSLRISLESGDRVGGYKANGLILERDIDMVDRKEVYVLRLKQGTPEYAEGGKISDRICGLYKELDKAKKPAEPSLETRVQEPEQNIPEWIRKVKEIRKEFAQRGYTEEPAPVKQEEYNVREPIQLVSEVTESALREVKGYRKAPMPESLRLYLRDAYNKIEKGKLGKAREKLRKISKETKKLHPITFRLLYKKLAKAENEKRETSNVFWNRCKRAAAYGIVGGLLLFFSGMSVKHEIELNNLPERLEPIPPYPTEEIDRLHKRVEEHK